VRHPTTDSNRGSIYSASTNIVKENLGPEHTVFNALYCSFATIIVVAPAVIGLLLFKFIPVIETKVFVLQDVGGLMELVSVTAVDSDITSWSHPDFIKGSLGNCSNPGELMLFTNSQNCKSKDAKGGIMVDRTPVQQWRVSSPLALPKMFERDEENPIPFVTIRQVDWQMLGLLSLNTTMGLAFNGIKAEHLEEIVSCNEDQTIQIDEASWAGCHQKKFLQPDGTIFQKICLHQTCFKNGQICEEYQKEFKLSVSCSNFSLESIQFVDARGQILQQADFNIGSEAGKFCCRNTTNIVEAFGKGCSRDSSQIIKQAKACRSRLFYREAKCDPFQKFSSFCTVNNSCVIKESYSTPCGFEKEVLNICRNQQLFC